MSCLAKMWSTLSAILGISSMSCLSPLSSEANSTLTQSMSLSWILVIHMMTMMFFIVTDNTSPVAGTMTSSTLTLALARCLLTKPSILR